MKRAWLWIAIALPIAGCNKESAKQRAQGAVSAKAFWTEAPEPTDTRAPRTFAYKPENIGAYALTATGGTPGDAKLSIQFTMAMDLAFAPGKAPRERAAFIKKLTLDMRAAGQTISMRLDHDEFYFKQGAEEARFKRGEHNDVLDVGAMTDLPSDTFVFGETDITVRPNLDHPFAKLGGSTDMLDNALVLFPDLPKGTVEPGYKWSVTRNVPVGSTSARVDLAYDFTFVGTGPCPSGASTCALFGFEAASKSVDATTDEGRKIKVTYGFAGKVFFDLERGVVDESRVRLDTDALVEGMSMQLGGTFTLKPVR
jgi:hypothetical protein